MRHITSTRDDSEKIRKYLQAAIDWLLMRQNSREIGRLLHRKGIHSIGIYGMGDFAECLINELKGSGIDVLFGIDRKQEKCSFFEGDIYKPGMKYPSVDAIIITPFVDLYDIRDSILSQNNCEVISLEELIYD